MTPQREIMKKILTSILVIACFLSSKADGAVERIRSPEEITYEWLVDLGTTTAYTDHVPHFKKIFEHLKVKTFLEFGVGYSTKYFLDSSKKVISVEFVTHGYGPSWIMECIDLYHDYSNWIPLIYFTGFKGDTDWAQYKYLGSEHVYKAVSYQTVTHKNYALIDDFYLNELNAFISNLVKCYNINVAFVDSGLYLRGDLVQLSFNKIPVIVAHDTTVRALGQTGDVYGYSRIVTPENYEEIFIQHGQGTTVWIIKTDPYKKLTEEIKKYASDIRNSSN